MSKLIDEDYLTRKPRNTRRTEAWRRSTRESTRRWRGRHPEAVARWQEEYRARVRAWSAVTRMGVRMADLDLIVAELGLETMSRHRRYSRYDTLRDAFTELCARQGDKCKLCKRPFCIDHVVRCTDGTLWGLVCAQCATYVHGCDGPVIDVAVEMGRSVIKTGKLLGTRDASLDGYGHTDDDSTGQ